jgi:hypothetical protein
MTAKKAPKADAIASDDAVATPQVDVTGGPADADAVIAPIESSVPEGSRYEAAPDLPADTVAQIEVRD